MPELTIAERVAAGADWLDANWPGWDYDVEPRILDLASDCKCILGQLYGDYGDGLSETDLTQDEARAFGFYAGVVGEEEATRDYPLLTEAWLKTIEARRG